MTLGSRRAIVGGLGLAAIWVIGVAGAGGQAPSRGQAAPTQQPPMAEEVFKNVQVLKGIPVDEFMGTMGVFSAALGMSCEDCHESGGSSWDDYAKDTSPRKIITRRMVTMMAAINKDHFQGRQVVTCYSCHRGGNRPKVTPSLDLLYGEPLPPEPDDMIFVSAPGSPPAEQVLDKYIQAIGGAGRLAKLTSFVAKGKATGYGPEGERPIEVFARAPAQRTTIIHTANGDNTTAYDGRVGWFAAPLRPVDVLPLTKHDLEGARLEAQLAFPGGIKQALTRWRVGYPASIGDRPVHVLQGTTPGGATATLYFDEESGLLVRLLRYADSPVGRFPTQVDYSDYREVAGVRMPFKWTLTWLAGQEAVELSGVQPNVPIDASKFARPPAPAKAGGAAP
jgi:photosynthetic reaction center cytochrome c subunit